MKSARSLDPYAPWALRASVLAITLVMTAAVVSAGVRILPWVLDPTIAWATLAPFAKSLVALAIEAAILVGWPVGWAIATQRLVERGEATVLATLGEAPPTTLKRLLPQGLAIAVVLSLASGLLGREAAAPGRVVNALLGKGRTACESAKGPETFGVPFASATWLCAPPAPPRIVGRAPIGAVAFSATGAHVTDDLRRIDLDDAQIALPINPTSAVRVHVATLTLRGLAPWARASAIHPVLRAAIVSASGALAACAAVLALLLLSAKQKRVGNVLATAIGAAGPVAALATLRAIEVRLPEDDHVGGAWLALLLLAPLVAPIAVSLLSWVVLVLPERRVAGTK